MFLRSCLFKLKSSVLSHEHNNSSGSSRSGAKFILEGLILFKKKFRTPALKPGFFVLKDSVLDY